MWVKRGRNRGFDRCFYRVFCEKKGKFFGDWLIGALGGFSVEKSDLFAGFWVLLKT